MNPSVSISPPPSPNTTATPPQSPSPSQIAQRIQTTLYPYTPQGQLNTLSKIFQGLIQFTTDLGTGIGNFALANDPLTKGASQITKALQKYNADSEARQAKLKSDKANAITQSSPFNKVLPVIAIGGGIGLLALMFLL